MDQEMPYFVHPHLPLQPNDAEFPVSSLSSSFKLDEGYSDETQSQIDREFVPDATILPDWLRNHSEKEKIEIAYELLRSLSTPAIAGIIERINPLLHMDPVLRLPTELTDQIFSYLEPRNLLDASLASRSWRHRILNSSIFRGCFINEGWKADIQAIHNFEHENAGKAWPRKARPHSETELDEPQHKKRVPSSWRDSGDHTANGEGHAESSPEESMVDVEEQVDELSFNSSNSSPQNSPVIQPPLRSSLVTCAPDGSPRINWVHLYKQRRRLEANWHHGRHTNFQLPHPSHPEEAHGECVYAIQFEGKWLVSGSRDKTVRVWDLETKRLWHRPLIGHARSVLCLQFDPSPEEDIIISGSSDQSVIMWRFSTGEKLHQISSAHEDSVLNLKFDSRYLVTCSKDRMVKVWNRRELSVTDESYPRKSRGSTIHFPDYIINLDNIEPDVLQSRLFINEYKPLKPYTLLMTIQGHNAAINAMELRGDEIVTASGDRTIKVWNIRDGTCKKTLMGHHTKGIACVEFDGRRIISGSNDNTVRIFDHITGVEVAVLRGHHNLVRTVQAGYGDPPGAEEKFRNEVSKIENAFWKAQQDGVPVGIGPRARRRAGHNTNLAGSQNPLDLPALGAKLPPGGGSNEWSRIVSGSYDETIIVWHKGINGWVESYRLRHQDAVNDATRDSLSDAARAVVSTQAGQLQAAAHVLAVLASPAATNGPNGNPNNAVPAPAPRPIALPRTHRLPQPLSASRVFKVQFDSRKIICASVDPRIVGWDFANGDEEIIEACPYFQVL